MVWSLKIFHSHHFSCLELCFPCGCTSWSDGHVEQKGSNPHPKRFRRYTEHTCVDQQYCSTVASNRLDLTMALCSSIRLVILELGRTQGKCTTGKSRQTDSVKQCRSLKEQMLVREKNVRQRAVNFATSGTSLISMRWRLPWGEAKSTRFFLNTINENLNKNDCSNTIFKILGYFLIVGTHIRQAHEEPGFKITVISKDRHPPLPLPQSHASFVQELLGQVIPHEKARIRSEQCYKSSSTKSPNGGSFSMTPDAIRGTSIGTVQIVLSPVRNNALRQIINGYYTVRRHKFDYFLDGLHRSHLIHTVPLVRLSKSTPAREGPNSGAGNRSSLLEVMNTFGPSVQAQGTTRI